MGSLIVNVQKEGVPKNSVSIFLGTFYPLLKKSPEMLINTAFPGFIFSRKSASASQSASEHIFDSKSYRKEQSFS